MPARRLAVFLLLALAVAARARDRRAWCRSRRRSPRSCSRSTRGNAIVGVDEVSAQAEPRVRALPRVGGLFNPSLEAIVALRPSAVALVPSAQQRELRERLEALGIEVLALPNIRYQDVLSSIVLARRARRARRGRARARGRRSEKAWGEARADAARAPRVRAVLVLQREPLYVVGRGSFLDTMLECAGAENLAREFDDPYPRVSVEWLIAAAPELILDAADPAAGAARALVALAVAARGRQAAASRRSTARSRFRVPISTARSPSSPRSVRATGGRGEGAHGARGRAAARAARRAAGRIDRARPGRGAELAGCRRGAARALAARRGGRRGRHRAARAAAARAARGRGRRRARGGRRAVPGAAAQSARGPLRARRLGRRRGRRDPRALARLGARLGRRGGAARRVRGRAPDHRRALRGGGRARARVGDASPAHRGGVQRVRLRGRSCSSRRSRGSPRARACSCG